MRLLLLVLLLTAAAQAQTSLGPEPLAIPAAGAQAASFEAEEPAAWPPGVHVEDGEVSVHVSDEPLSDVLHALASQAGLSLVLQASTPGSVTANWGGRSLESALDLLLMGSPLTYKRDGDVVVIAGRDLPAMVTSELVALEHVPAGGLVERLPESLRMQATVRLVPEHNALLVTGPADVVGAVKAFVDELDAPPNQILLEVLVVEFETNNLREAGVSVVGGGGTPEDADGMRAAYGFGTGMNQRDPAEVVTDGPGVSRFLNFWAEALGLKTIGHLPTDFYVRLRALEQAGMAEVRSRPHIATLNGHTATISVGTSQYYILKSANPYGYGEGSRFNQAEVERFEYVQADVRLQITPWVGDDGAVTAVIQPSFTSPVGGFDPRIPPALYNWSVDTSVRLQDGETFMIGGLVQERERSVQNRIPILGGLPLIGRLFRNERKEKKASELVIFITPHVLRDGEEVPAEATQRLAPNGAPRPEAAEAAEAGW